MTIITAALLICVVIAVSMPKTQDYHTDLNNINYRLSQIADYLARLGDKMDKMGDSDGHTD